MKAVHDCTDFADEGSMALQESFQWGEFDLGECLVPLKTTNDLPKTNNTLRNVTQNTSGPLPPSPAIIKKKNMARISSPMDAPGSISVATITSAATLNGCHLVRSSIQNPIGGSLHGVGRRPGDKSRTRSISPTAPIVRSRSPGPLGGSLHSRTSSPTALFMGGASSGRPMRRRSNSPGSFKSASVHGTSSIRPRSRSPGALQGRNRSFRVARRMSLKSNKGPTGLVSILRKGKFSGNSTTTATATSSSSSIPLPSALPSPPGSPTLNSSSSHQRRRLLVGKRVTFWFPDEQSLACSFATEESMAFGDLGFDDSGEGFGTEDDYGLRTIRGGELPFIEVMGDYARGGDDDDEDDDYLVKRFNGSTIHEELGMSFGEGNFTTSFSSFLSDESEENHLDKEKNNDPPASQPKEQDKEKDDSQVRDRLSSCFDSSQDSFALPDFGEDDVMDKAKKSKNLHKDGKKSKNKGKRNSVNDDNYGDDNKYHESFCAYQGSFALPDFEDDYEATRKNSKNTRPNKSKNVDDSDDDEDSFGLPDLSEDDDIAMTKTTNQSKKSKNNVKDKNTKDNEQASAALPDVGDGSRKTTKKNKSKAKNNDKDVGVNADRQESLDSFALSDVDDEMISHKKKSKKNKNKDAQDGDENMGVDKQETLSVRRGSFTLTDMEEDGISHKKKTKKNKNKEVHDVADVDRQKSLGSCAFEDDMIGHKKKTKKAKNKGMQNCDEDKDMDKQESLGASRDSLDTEDDIISHKKKTKKNKNKDVQDCDEEKDVDKRESLNSFALEDDTISHKKKNKKNKNKVVQAVDEDKNVDKQESLDVSQGSVALPEIEEDTISHKKETAIENKNKGVPDVDEDNDVERQESLGVCQGSFTLPDSGDDQAVRITYKKKTNQQDTENCCNVTNINTYNSKEKDSAVVDRQDSFGQNQDSFVSLVFAEDETLHKTNKSSNSNKDSGDDDDDDDGQESFSQGSFALPDNMDSSSLSSSPYHQYSNRSRVRQQHPIFCQLPRSRRRNPTPPPGLRHSSRASSTSGGGGTGSSSSSTLSSSSFSSSLRLEEVIMTPVRQKTTAQVTPTTSSSSAAWCCSESSLELSALRDSSKAPNRDSLSETSSSESPTSVTELGGVSSQMGIGVAGGEDNGLNSMPGDEEDTEHRRLTVKRSMVSTLVPPIG